MRFDSANMDLRVRFAFQIGRGYHRLLAVCSVEGRPVVVVDGGGGMSLYPESSGQSDCLALIFLINETVSEHCRNWLILENDSHWPAQAPLPELHQITGSKDSKAA